MWTTGWPLVLWSEIQLVAFLHLCQSGDKKKHEVRLHGLIWNTFMRSGICILWPRVRPRGLSRTGAGQASSWPLSCGDRNSGQSPSFIGKSTINYHGVVKMPIWWFPKIGAPPVIILILDWDIFHEINQPAIGDPPWPWKPPNVRINGFQLK